MPKKGAALKPGWLGREILSARKQIEEDWPEWKERVSYLSNRHSDGTKSTQVTNVPHRRRAAKS